MELDVYRQSPASKPPYCSAKVAFLISFSPSKILVMMPRLIIVAAVVCASLALAATESDTNKDDLVGRESALAGHSQIYWDEDNLAGKIRYLYKERYPDPKAMANKVFFNAPFTPPLSRQSSPLRSPARISTSRMGPDVIRALSDARRSSALNAPVTADTGAQGTLANSVTASRRLSKGKGIAEEQVEASSFRAPSPGPARLDNIDEMKQVWSKIQGSDSPISSMSTKNLNKEMSFSQMVAPGDSSSKLSNPPPAKVVSDTLPDLEPAKAKLAAYAEHESEQSRIPRWIKPFRNLWPWSKTESPLAKSGSHAEGEDAATGSYSTTEMHTPLDQFSPELPSSPLSGAGGDQPQAILPYRAWSERKALRGVKIPESSGIQKLTDHRVTHWEHWKSTLETYRKQTFWDRYLERMFWVARNAQQDTTEHRALVNGVVTGTTSYSKLKFGPIDPKDPPPPHPGKRETMLEERMEVFQRLFYRVPPALTYHSPEAFRQNAEGYYIYAADPEIQKVVHPIHYLQQILVNPRATGILENYNAKDQQAVEEYWIHNRRLDHTISTSDRAVLKVSEQKAVRNMFWPKAWQLDPAFDIKDPLTTPIQDWQVFEPYVRAVQFAPH